MQKVDQTCIVLEKLLCHTLHSERDKLRCARESKDETIDYSTHIKMCSHTGKRFDLKPFLFFYFTVDMDCELLAYATATCSTATSYGALGETSRVGMTTAVCGYGIGSALLTE
jgi:hypothetical protein